MRARGQAITEVALGLLVLVPIIIGGVYLAEVSMFRLEATEAATEPMWDATAHANNAYTGAFDRTPGAVATANREAQGRQRPRAMVFTQGAAATVACSAGTGLGLTLTPTSSVYTDNGGISCTSQLEVDPKGMPSRFLDDGPGFFKEPLASFQKQFRFAQNEAGTPFRMAIGDWGLAKQGQEPAECRLTMDSCANQGFFDFSKTTYDAHRTAGGTRGRAYLTFVEYVVISVPAELDRVVEHPLSFRGEESGFTEQVPVSEGDRPWRTSPSLGPWGASHAARAPRYLGLP